MACTTSLSERVGNFNFKGEIVLLGEVILLEEASKVFRGGGGGGEDEVIQKIQASRSH